MGKLKRPYDPIQQEYVERELQKLQAEQEMLRASKGMGGPTDKMPTTGFSGQFGPAEFKYGGKKKYAGGGFDDYKRPGPTWEEEYFQGYQPMTDLRMPITSLTSVDNNYLNIPTVISPQELPKDLRYSNDADIMNKMNQIHTSMDTQEADMKKIYAANDKTVMNKMYAGPETPKQKFDWAGAGVLGAQLAGDVAGLAYSLRKPNYAKYQRISPELVNYNQAATDITNSAGLMEQSAAGALRNQGQSSGAYLNNRINLASRLGQQTGAQLAELRMNEANTNVGIKNDAKTRNAEIQRAEVETNAKEKDSKWQALVGHLGGIGSKVAGYSKDKNQMKLDKAQFAQLLKYSPDLFRSFDLIQNSDNTITLKQK